MPRKTPSAFLKTALFFSLALPSLAATASDRLPQLKIGISSRTAPYVINLEHGQGIEPELLNFLVREMNYQPVLQSVPFKRHALIMKAQKLDAISLWSLPEGLDCHLSNPYRYWRNALFVPRLQAGEKLAPIKALQQDRIGIFQGSEGLAEELAELGIPHNKLRQIPSIEGAVRMLQYGRLSGYIGDYPTVIYSLGPAHANDVIARHYFAPVPQRLCFLDPELAAAFNATLGEITEAGGWELANITERHGFYERITPPLTVPKETSTP